MLNIPLFIAGWLILSRRFFFYSLFGVLVVTLAIDLIPFVIPIKDRLLAALAGGTLIGAGRFWCRPKRSARLRKRSAEMGRLIQPHSMACRFPAANGQREVAYQPHPRCIAV